MCDYDVICVIRHMLCSNLYSPNPIYRPIHMYYSEKTLEHVIILLQFWSMGPKWKNEAFNIFHEIILQGGSPSCKLYDIYHWIWIFKFRYMDHNLLLLSHVHIQVFTFVFEVSWPDSDLIHYIIFYMNAPFIINRACQIRDSWRNKIIKTTSHKFCFKNTLALVSPIMHFNPIKFDQSWDIVHLCSDNSVNNSLVTY